MQSTPRSFTVKASLTHENGAGSCLPKSPLDGTSAYGVPVSAASGVPLGLGGTNPEFPCPLRNGYEFQPTKSCPRNFIIFDQTNDKGRVMYHPASIHKFCPANYYPYSCHAEAGCKSSSQDNENVDRDSSSFKEDTREIDALLSLDEDFDGEDDEDDVVSTGRTPGHCRSDSLDSFSTLDSTEQHLNFYEALEDVNQEKMRKMIAVMREIIPDGNQLDTSAVLEEAVRYLKHLKMEVKKLGVESFDA